MNISDTIRTQRKAKGLTQEQLAEQLGVSRQALSKWEANQGYPELTTLVALAKRLDISLDALLLEKQTQTPTTTTVVQGNKITILSYDQQIVTCRGVRSNPIAFAKKGEPRYVLVGITGNTFFGETTQMLGWYASKADVDQEVRLIMQQMELGHVTYELQHNAKIRLEGIFGQPKLEHD
ncbi:MAG: helix-turn-helix domain-containing protein [Erysipelotrichaceae bacterium]